MRNQLLGTIAAVAAGAGMAWGQAPANPIAPPMPIAPGGIYPVQGMDIPSPMGMGGPGMGGPGMGGPGMGGPGMGGPGMGGPGMGDPNGVFPGGMPPGVHGQQQWQPPFNGAEPQGVNGRLAPRAWFTTDYMLAFAKAQPTSFPFVVSSAPAAGGILGATSTNVLHSNSDLGYNLISGVRFDGGFFRDDARRFGYYASGFFTEQKANVFNVASDATGQGLLARPFINANTNGPDVLLVSFPTFAAGSTTIYSSTRAWGAEGGPIINLYRSCPEEIALWNINLLTGFRFLQVREVLRMEQDTTLVGNSTAAFDGKLYGNGSQISVSDSFDATNRFYGGQLGLNVEMRLNRWYLNTTGKIALGVMNERVDVTGISSLQNQALGLSSRVSGGLFANSSNIGKHNQDQFAAIPEVDVKLGYTWRSWLTTAVGYNFLYVSRLARPGDQYSPVVNPGVIPTSPTYGLGTPIVTPNPLGTQSSYYLQGVNFSITMRY